MKSLTRWDLQMIAVVLMVLEHSAEVLAHFSSIDALIPILHYAGRIVFPLFVYLMVEGFFKTSNRVRYMSRVFGFAAFMSVGSIALLYAIAYVSGQSIGDLAWTDNGLLFLIRPLGYNVLWSLGTGLLFLYLLDKVRGSSLEKKVLLVMSLLCLWLFSLLNEFSYMIVPLFVILYWAYGDNKRVLLGYGAYCGMVAIAEHEAYGELFHDGYQWMMLAAVPLFLLYNGEKGNARWRYLFYVVYPLHLWALFVLRYWLGV